MRIPRSVIALVVLGVLVALVWSRLRIVLFIPITPLQAFFFFTITAVVLFLLIDHWLNRTKE